MVFMNPWSHDALMPFISEVDRAFLDSEKVFGVGRLETLVSAATLSSYRRGWTAWRQAIENGDQSAVEALAPKMVAALAYMSKEALQRGHSPLSVDAWETPMEDGAVLVVCRTSAEASAVVRENNGSETPRQLCVWALAEIARIIPAVPVVDEIKRAFPGAKVTKGPKKTAKLEDDDGFGHLFPGVLVEKATITDEGDVADWARSDPTRKIMESES